MQTLNSFRVEMKRNLRPRGATETFSLFLDAASADEATCIAVDLYPSAWPVACSRCYGESCEMPVANWNW